MAIRSLLSYRESRPMDYLYDPDCILSSARDYSKAQQQTQMSEGQKPNEVDMVRNSSVLSSMSAKDLNDLHKTETQLPRCAQDSPVIRARYDPFQVSGANFFKHYQSPRRNRDPLPMRVQNLTFDSLSESRNSTDNHNTERSKTKKTTRGTPDSNSSGYSSLQKSGIFVKRIQEEPVRIPHTPEIKTASASSLPIAKPQPREQYLVESLRSKRRVKPSIELMKLERSTSQQSSKSLREVRNRILQNQIRLTEAKTSLPMTNRYVERKKYATKEIEEKLKRLRMRHQKGNIIERPPGDTVCLKHRQFSALHQLETQNVIVNDELRDFNSSLNTTQNSMRSAVSQPEMHAKPTETAATAEAKTSAETQPTVECWEPVYDNQTESEGEENSTRPITVLSVNRSNRSKRTEETPVAAVSNGEPADILSKMTEDSSVATVSNFQPADISTVNNTVAAVPSGQTVDILTVSNTTAAVSDGQPADISTVNDSDCTEEDQKSSMATASNYQSEDLAQSNEASEQLATEEVNEVKEVDNQEDLEQLEDSTKKRESTDTGIGSGSCSDPLTNDFEVFHTDPTETVDDFQVDNVDGTPVEEPNSTETTVKSAPICSVCARQISSDLEETSAVPESTKMLTSAVQTSDDSVEQILPFSTNQLERMMTTLMASESFKHLAETVAQSEHFHNIISQIKRMESSEIEQKSDSIETLADTEGHQMFINNFIEDLDVRLPTPEGENNNISTTILCDDESADLPNRSQHLAQMSDNNNGECENTTVVLNEQLQSHISIAVEDLINNCVDRYVLTMSSSAHRSETQMENKQVQAELDGYVDTTIAEEATKLVIKEFEENWIQEEADVIFRDLCHSLDIVFD